MEKNQSPTMRQASEDSSTSFEIKHSDKPKSTGWRFAVALCSLCLIGFMSSLDGSIIATALPRVSQEIRSESSDDYVWIANCFLLSSTVIQPPLAQLCNIFGRRNPMLISVALFTLGSGVAGGSNSAQMLIAGRTIQGLGSGGIMMLIEMIVCDLVPMRQRGKYLGIVLSMCAVGAVLGPVVGGALVEASWRWVFYINMPVGGLVLATLALCLRLQHQQEPTWKRSLRRVDWIGSSLFIASMCALLLGLIFGGARYSWSSWRVIVPLVLGVLGWIAFHIYESSGACAEPSVPPVLFKNRTSVVGYLLVFLSSILLQWVAFFIPLYFQSVRQVDPLKSGIDFLPFQAFLIPAAMIAGGILTKTGSYKPLHLLGFAFAAIGVGLFTLLDSTSPVALWVISQAIEAIGQGLVTPSLLPAIQASLDESEVATSTGVFSFLRSFGYTWGITIPGIVFNNRWDQLSSRIQDPAIRQDLAGGRAYVFAGSMYLHPFNETTRAQIISVYTETLRTVWIAAIPFAVVAFFAVFLERRVKLREGLETEYGLDERSAKDDEQDGERNGGRTSE